MANCGPPSYAIPSCASSPVIGFGSAHHGYGGLHTGFGSGPLVHAGVPSASLGTLSGVEPSCINQIPPAEVLIQPPPSVVIMPGPILSATGQPVKVGGNTPCAVTYGGHPVRVGGRFRRGSFGQLGGGSLGQGGNVIVGRRGSTCYTPH
uniref:feather keratin 4-like n=1 Tax=Euleptes europaea TaxID=460621 RepID=UPI002540F40C|nr:feather keratin 4-like [Euleptes europaea]